MKCRLSKPGPIPPQFSPFPLRIGRSKIHRWGVFALDSIPKGRKVIEYTGERLTYAQANRRFRRNLRLGRPRDNVYFARLNRRIVIDGIASPSGVQFINHSCDPNLSVRRSRGRIFLFSRRRIRPGQELLSDYAYRKELPRVPCRCGSPICRGVMNKK